MMTQRQPDEYEDSIIAWLDAHGFRSLAQGLKEYIESNFAGTPKPQFVVLALTDIARSKSEDDDLNDIVFLHAAGRIEALGMYWQQQIKLYACDD
jgi:hypothetical protein